jgi:hypothetical protein
MILKFLFGFSGISQIGKVLKGLLIVVLLSCIVYGFLKAWSFVARNEPSVKHDLKALNLRVDSLTNNQIVWQNYASGLGKVNRNIDSLRMAANLELGQQRKRFTKTQYET